METWVPIRGTSKYEISNYGDVRVRMKSGKTKPHRIQERFGGRQYVTLSVGGRSVERYIDDLVIEHFEEGV